MDWPCRFKPKSGGRGFLTTYAYNNAGQVASISQKQSISNITQTQTRSFTYDPMGRAITSTYPESGTMQLFYDNAPSTPGVDCAFPSSPGNLVKTYDPNGTTTCYGYDSLNRVTSLLYSGP